MDQQHHSKSVAPRPSQEQPQRSWVRPPAAYDRYLLPLLLLALADGLVFALAAWLAYPIRFGTFFLDLFPVPAGWVPPPFGTFFKFGLLAGVTGIIVFERLGFYRAHIGLDRKVHVFRIAWGTLISCLILQLVLSILETPISRLTRLISFLLTIPLATAVHAIMKTLHHRLVQGGLGFRRCLLVCESGEQIPLMMERIFNQHGSLFQPVGALAVVPHPPAEKLRAVADEDLYLGSVDQLRLMLARYQIDTVLLSLEPHQTQLAQTLINVCESFGVDYFVEPVLFEHMLEQLPVGGDLFLPVICLGETPLSGSAVVLKRAFDLGVSATLLLVGAPVWLLLAALIKLESPGPIFYSQERLGHDGRAFNILKFRSMVVNAESQTGPIWASKDDQRRTKLGRWMRNWNVDEIPQLINVFRGEMSLVGPRPERPFFVDKFKETIPNYLRRHVVRSGMTGWAQVHGLRGDTSIEDRTRYDMWYIQNWTFWLDIKILFRTFVAHENAH